MKKVGSIILLVLGIVFLLYGFIIAHSGGFIRSLVPAISIFWAIVLCLFNMLIPQIKKKTWMQIVTIIVFVLLIWNSVTELSSLTNIPKYMITDVWPGYEIIMFHCPHVFVLFGLVLLVIGGRILGKKRYKVWEEQEYPNE